MDIIVGGEYGVAVVPKGRLTTALPDTVSGSVVHDQSFDVDGADELEFDEGVDSFFGAAEAGEEAVELLSEDLLL
ncbi:MAG: hypothetical protein WCW35_10325 [Bacteroidota bacterium]